VAGFVLPLTFVLAFVAAAMMAQAVAGLLFTNRDRSRRVNRRMTLLDSGMDRQQVLELLVKKPVAPAFKDVRLIRAYDKAVNFLGQAGISLSPLHILAGVACGGFALALVVIAVLRGAGAAVGPTEFVVSLVGAIGLASSAAWVWLSGARTARLKKLEEQLPLALDIVVRALRAGHPVVSAVQLVTEELADPIGTEFGLIVDETNYGVEFREALTNFARRTGSDDAHFFAVSVSIQSETGGNLAEILTNLATVVRSRLMLARRVKSLSSEGRMSAIILSALPVLLITFLMFVQPTFYTSKFNNPVFWPIAGVIFLIYLVGVWMMRRIIDIKY
jgi:tight adherence protein B